MSYDFRRLLWLAGIATVVYVSEFASGALTLEVGNVGPLQATSGSLNVDIPIYLNVSGNGAPVKVNALNAKISLSPAFSSSSPDRLKIDFTAPHLKGIEPASGWNINTPSPLSDGAGHTFSTSFQYVTGQINIAMNSDPSAGQGYVTVPDTGVSTLLATLHLQMETGTAGLYHLNLGTVAADESIGDSATDDLDPKQWDYPGPSGISEFGVPILEISNGSFLVAQVPEPSVMTLAGAVSLLGLARRRSRCS